MEELPDFATTQEREQLAQLEAQLDWHHRADAGLTRLKSRLRAAGKPRARVMPFVRRFAAVAALLLVALGLTSRFGPPSDERQGTIPGVVASLIRSREEEFPEHAIARLTQNDKPPPVRAAPAFPHAVTREHVQLTERGRLPSGPRVDLLLEVKNDSNRAITLDVGGPRTMLQLDLRGPGTKTLFGKADDPPFLVRRELKLEPGGSCFVPIPYLIGGQRGQLQGVYWTRPGQYTLSVLYRVGVKEEQRDLYVSSPRLVMDVRD